MLSTIEKVLFLKGVDLFSKIPSDDLARVAQIAQEETFEDGEHIITQGEMGDCLYLIVRGKVRILVGDNEVAQLGERKCVGEMAILDSEPRSASVVSLSTVDLLKIERDAFYELMAEKVEIAQGIIKVITHRLRETNAKLMQASQKSK